MLAWQNWRTSLKLSSYFNGCTIVENLSPRNQVFSIKITPNSKLKLKQHEFITHKLRQRVDKVANYKPSLSICSICFESFSLCVFVVVAVSNDKKNNATGFCAKSRVWTIGKKTRTKKSKNKKSNWSVLTICDENDENDEDDDDSDINNK